MLFVSYQVIVSLKFKMKFIHAVYSGEASCLASSRSCILPPCFCCCSRALLLAKWPLSPHAALSACSVTDPTGAVISGATISATNEATGGKNETKSTSAGAYKFADIPIGVYTVTVTAPGFATATDTGVLVQINITSSLNVTLKTGAVNEVVSVDASGNRIEDSLPISAEQSPISKSKTCRCRSHPVWADCDRRRRLSFCSQVQQALEAVRAEIPAMACSSQG